MRCICCNKILHEFDDDWCSKCIEASKDTWTKFKDPQLMHITEPKKNKLDKESVYKLLQ